MRLLGVTVTSFYDEPGGRRNWLTVPDHSLWRTLDPLGDWAELLAAPDWANEHSAERLRAATSAGKPLGNREFIENLSRRTGVALELRRPGRPRKQHTRAAAAGA